MTAITLTKCQEAAYAAIVKLITDPSQKYLVIEGGAGTGKTTLIDTFMTEWETTVALTAGAFEDQPIYLTATTNKAADALSQATGREVTTINSLLGIRVQRTGYKQSTLEWGGKEKLCDSIIFIDEASFISEELLNAIFVRTVNCKIIFLGDPYQLPPVGFNESPVFMKGFKTVVMSEIKRQGHDSPIKVLSRNLRELVRTGGAMPKAGVDGVHILHLNHEDFLAEISSTFSQSRNSRILAWTNERANYYNQYVSQMLNGSGDIQEGDTVVINKMYARNSRNGNVTFKYPADSTMTVNSVGAWYTDHFGLTVRNITNHNQHIFIQPENMESVEEALKLAYANNEYERADRLEKRYADLRHPYGSTVNKSQGSTYDSVFVDLSDIGRCREKSQKHRMLYVAASRARDRVVFTGDI